MPLPLILKPFLHAVATASQLPSNVCKRRGKRRTEAAETLAADLEAVDREVTSALRRGGTGGGVDLAEIALAVEAKVAACDAREIGRAHV